MRRGTSWARWPGSLGLGALPGLTVVTAASAQSAPQAGSTPTLQGQVARLGEPLAGVEVVLHRIAVDQAGEIDTVQAAVNGRFAFELPTVPTSEAEGDVYFASVRHQGILYFGSAVSRASQVDSLYLVNVHDTVTVAAGGAKLPVAVRYLVVEPTGIEGQDWRVTDLFEVAHEGDRTFVPPAEGGLTWSHPLPVGIDQVQIGGGELSPDAARTVDGRLELSGPIAPGQRQFVLRYVVADLERFEVPLEPGTREVEMLIAEPSPAVEVEGLSAVETIEIQPGLSFRRYVGTAEEGGTLRLELVAPPRPLPLRELVVVLALLMTVVGLWAALRGSAPHDVARTVVDSAETARGTDSGVTHRTSEERLIERRRLLLEVARLDERLDAVRSAAAPLSTDDEAQLSELEARREHLVEQLRELS